MPSGTSTARSSSTRSSAQRVVARVRRAEHDAVGERERLPGELAVAAPVGVVGEVGGVVVGDRVELGEHDPAPEPRHQQQIARRRHLVGAVDDVARLGVVVDLVVPDPLDPEPVEDLARPVAERARDGDAQPHAGPPRERAGELEREHLRAGQRRPERGAVDRHRQLADRQPGGGQRARERDLLRRRRLLHGLRVVGVAAVELRLVGELARRARAAERARAAVEDVEVVGHHVPQPARQAALAEVDLLAVAGRERLVEAADEVERRAADVEAVADPGRDPRVQPRRGAGDPRVGLGDREPRRRRRLRAVAVGDGEDRAVVGERARGGDEPVGVGGGAQALEPRGGHDGVGVDDHHVGGRGVVEDGVHVADEAEVLRRGARTRPRTAGAAPRPGSVNASISRSGLASSATSTCVPGGVCSTTLRRHCSNSSRAPNTGTQTTRRRASRVVPRLELGELGVRSRTPSAARRRCRAGRAAAAPRARRCAAPGPRAPSAPARSSRAGGTCTGARRAAPCRRPSGRRRPRPRRGRRPASRARPGAAARRRPGRPRHLAGVAREPLEPRAHRRAGRLGRQRRRDVAAPALGAPRHLLAARADLAHQRRRVVEVGLGPLAHRAGRSRRPRRPA